MVDALVTGCDGGISSSRTARWIRAVNCSTAGGNGAQSTAPGAAAVTMGYTVPVRLVGPDRHGCGRGDGRRVPRLRAERPRRRARPVVPGSATSYGVTIHTRRAASPTRSR